MVFSNSDNEARKWSRQILVKNNRSASESLGKAGLARRRLVRRPGMAGDAGGGSVVLLVAADAACHRGDTGGLRHGIELADIAVAHDALHARLEVLAMAPGDAGRDLIDAHPRDGLTGLIVLGKLHDGGFVFGDAGVAGHASARRGEGHQLAGIGICVAHLALELKREVRFVAVGDGLLRRRMRRKIIGDFLLGRVALRLLRSRARNGQKH